MSDKDLNDELKQKNQMNSTRKSQDANSNASSFLDNENNSKTLSKQELLKKIEAKSRDIVDEERVIINHRGKKNESTTAPSSSRKNTRGQSPELNTSGIKNTRKKVPAEIPKATPTAKNTQNNSSTDLNMNNLSPELQAQFAKFLSQANNNTQNFNNFNAPNFNHFNPNAFNFPNFDPSQMPNFNPNDFNNFNAPNFNPNDFGAGIDPNFNPNFDSNFNEPQQDTSINEQTASQPQSPSGFRPSPPPLPKKPIPPKQKPQEKTEEMAEINKSNAEVEELPTKEIPTDDIPISAENIEPEIEKVEDIPPIEEIESIEEIENIPNIEEIPQSPSADQSQPQTSQEQPNNNQPFDFNFANQIPEHEQTDIRALVDIGLEENINEVIAATNVNDMSATLGQAAENLIGNKMKRNVKGWLIVLGILLLLVAVFAYFWDDIFGKKINQEQAAGLTIIIIPSEGDKGSFDAKYTYYPGSEIKFQNSVRVGSELYRTEIREDGTEIQEENEAFAFRFRFFLEFTDEVGVEYQNLIESIVIPDEVQNVIKYDEVTGYFYYYTLVYPGEKYVPFANSIIINNSMDNEYQGREFKIVLDYSTIVPSSMEVMLGPDGLPDAPANWQEAMVFEFEQWANE